MKTINSDFAAVIAMTCLATMVFLGADRMYQTKFHLVAPPVEKIEKSHFGFHAHNSAKGKRRIGPIIRLDKAEHLEVLQKMIEGPILLDFHAVWCGPCKMLSKTIEQLADEDRLGEGVIIKIDIDQHPQLAQQYKVTTVPKLVLMDGKKVLNEQAGLAGPETIENWMLAHAAKPILGIGEIAFATMHDSVPIAAIGCLDRLTQRVRVIQKIVQQPNTAQT